MISGGPVLLNAWCGCGCCSSASSSIVKMHRGAEAAEGLHLLGLQDLLHLPHILKTWGLRAAAHGAARPGPYQPHTLSALLRMPPPATRRLWLWPGAAARGAVHPHL